MTTHSNAALVVDSFPVGPLQCNCTLIGDLATGQAWVIDPGGDVEKIAQKLAHYQLTLVGMLHTHAHFDHFMASQQLRQSTQVPCWLHAEDLFLWRNLEAQCQRFGIPYADGPIPDPDGFIEHEQVFDQGLPSFLGGIQTRWLPGHTPGSCGFWLEAAQTFVAGDTMFYRGVGRTDLWGGDAAVLTRSIRQHIYTLPPETRLITGHGRLTTVDEECRHNPYVQP